MLITDDNEPTRSDHSLFTRVKYYVQECIENRVKTIHQRSWRGNFLSFSNFFFVFKSVFWSYVENHTGLRGIEIFFLFWCVFQIILVSFLVTLNCHLFFPIFDQTSKSSLCSISTLNSNNQNVVQKPWLITFRLGKLR